MDENKRPIGSAPGSDPFPNQDRQWSRHATQYDELFLDPFRSGVDNPLLDWLAQVPDAGRKTVIDLGCGTGPLLPLLIERFGEVHALDFAPGMIKRAKRRLGKHASRVRFHTAPMHEIDQLGVSFDVVAAVNSVVMPDVRDQDQAISAVRRSLTAGGCFLGILPAMDAIHYHTMLLYDRALENGLEPSAAERQAAFQGEHHLYDFAFGRFHFQGLSQKFWQPFEIRHRMRKAGFTTVDLAEVLYPWDDSQIGYEDFQGMPRSWDWCFRATGSP